MVKLIQFEHIKGTGLVEHGFTTRHNGVSQGCFGTLNLGYNRGDTDENVTENFRRVAETVGLKLDDLVLSAQVHDTKILKVRTEDKGKGVTKDTDIVGVDGLMTNESGIGLTTFYADCVPLFFFDPVTKTACVSHAGWKGTLAKMGQVTVDTLQQEYGVNPKDLLVGIGPSIGFCCYEVSMDVKNKFTNVFINDIIAKIFSKPYLDKGGVERVKLNLQEANRHILLAAGVPDDNIEISGLCTMCREDLFFSHRRMGANRGSQVGVMVLK